MRKILTWVGVLALVLLILQSTIGIASYTLGGTSQGFANGANRMMGNNEGNGSRAMPPQNNSTGTEGASESNFRNSMPAAPQNGEMTGAGMNFGQQSSLSSSLRNLENGLPAFIMNCTSLGLGIAWFILLVLTRKQQKLKNLEV
ncbi:hypothetical protein ACVBAX_19825 [Robertmurraya sp. GLU-23]